MMEIEIRIRIKPNGQIYAETYGKPEQRKQIEDMDLRSKTATHVEA